MNGFSVETPFPCQQRESHFVVRSHDFSPQLSETKYKSNMWLVFFYQNHNYITSIWFIAVVDTIKIIGPALLRTEKCTFWQLGWSTYIFPHGVLSPGKPCPLLLLPLVPFNWKLHLKLAQCGILTECTEIKTRAWVVEHVRNIFVTQLTQCLQQYKSWKLLLNYSKPGHF